MNKTEYILNQIDDHTYELEIQAVIIDNAKGIISKPQSGQYEITGIRLDADLKVVITYNEIPEP